jgi:hypothetical protein
VTDAPTRGFDGYDIRMLELLDHRDLSTPAFSIAAVAASGARSIGWDDPGLAVLPSAARSGIREMREFAQMVGTR